MDNHATNEEIVRVVGNISFEKESHDETNYNNKRNEEELDFLNHSLNGNENGERDGEKSRGNKGIRGKRGGETLQIGKEVEAEAEKWKPSSSASSTLIPPTKKTKRVLRCSSSAD